MLHFSNIYYQLYYFFPEKTDRDTLFKSLSSCVLHLYQSSVRSSSFKNSRKATHEKRGYVWWRTIDDSTKRERYGCTKMPAWRHRYSRRAGPTSDWYSRGEPQKFVRTISESVAKVGARPAKRTSLRSIVFQSSFREIDIIVFESAVEEFNSTRDRTFNRINFHFSLSSTFFYF